MYSELIYQAQRAVIQERTHRASRPQPPRRPRHTFGRWWRARRAVAAVVRTCGLDHAQLIAAVRGELDAVRFGLGVDGFGV